MKLQESGEMYLETIYVLSRQSSSVRSVDVAKEMGYSKPAISRAVRLLKKLCSICHRLFYRGRSILLSPPRCSSRYAEGESPYSF